MTKEQKFAQMKIYKFGEHDSVEIIDGKTYYPAMLRLELSRQSLWRLIKQILSRLEIGNHCEEQYVFFGKLTEEDE